MAFRDRSENEGNFIQLRQSRGSDVPELATWLDCRCDFTRYSIQNKILQLFGNAIVREIAADCLKSHSFAVIVDGTQDITKTEQGSIYLRHVNDDLQPCEQFVGFYALHQTTAAASASVVKNDLLRLQQPLKKLRGQTYDVASNMSGAYNGGQTIMIQSKPLASYVHCTAHCSNLVASAACSSSQAIFNAI